MNSSVPFGPRILHVGKFYPPHRGGIETHLQELARALSATVDVKVVVTNAHGPRMIEQVDGVEVTRLRRLCTIASAPISFGLIDAIRRAKADLVHVHLPNPIAMVAYLASGHRGALVASWHSDIVRQATLNKILQPVVKAFTRRCAALVVASPNYIESSPLLPRYRNKCHVIPYGISIDRFAAPDPAAVRTIRARFGSRIVLAVGRLVQYKGFQFLIRAMEKVSGKLLLIGDGPLRKSLEQEARTLRLSDKVSFIGEAEDLGPYYAACDVFALPSVARSEAFGIVQLEALAAGKPVVNTLLDSGVPYVSLDRVTGLSVPPGDSDALAGALNELLDRPDLRHKFGQAGIERVRREFTVEKMIERTISLYRDVLEYSAIGVPAERRQWRTSFAESGAENGSGLVV